jgi:hypothetical protein
VKRWWIFELHKEQTRPLNGKMVFQARQDSPKKEGKRKKGMNVVRGECSKECVGFSEHCACTKKPLDKDERGRMRCQAKSVHLERSKASFNITRSSQDEVRGRSGMRPAAVQGAAHCAAGSGGSPRIVRCWRRLVGGCRRCCFLAAKCCHWAGVVCKG